MRMRITYKMNGKDMLEEGQINHFPHGLWSWTARHWRWSVELTTRSYSAWEDAASLAVCAILLLLGWHLLLTWLQTRFYRVFLLCSGSPLSCLKIFVEQVSSPKLGHYQFVFFGVHYWEREREREQEVCDLYKYLGKWILPLRCRGKGDLVESYMYVWDLLFSFEFGFSAYHLRLFWFGHWIFLSLSSSMSRLHLVKFCYRI